MVTENLLTTSDVLAVYRLGLQESGRAIAHSLPGRNRNHSDRSFMSLTKFYTLEAITLSVFFCSKKKQQGGFMIVCYYGFTNPERDLMQKLLSEYVQVFSLHEEEFMALNSLRRKFNLPEIEALDEFFHFIPFRGCE